MSDLSSTPKTRYAEQGFRGDTIKDSVLSLISNMLDREGASIVQHYVVVDEVLWIDSVTVKFPVPSGVANV